MQYIPGWSAVVKTLWDDDSKNSLDLRVVLTGSCATLIQAELMRGLNKYDPKFLREKASSPRIMVYNTALMSSMYGRRRKDLINNPSSRGRLIESAVGAYLINRSIVEDFDVSWWREGNAEVDFVIFQDEAVTAIEVKSGRTKPTAGMVQFQLKYPKSRSIMVG